MISWFYARIATFFIILVVAAPAVAQGPQIYFSDLTSGPNTGGENDKGTYVTIYGRGFGNARGESSVTIGGGSADNYPIWSDRKITLQLGSEATSGNITVKIGATSSNPVPFTVRPGTIRCVAPKGSIWRSGKWGSCWRTLTQAVDSARPGDVIYALEGSDQVETHRVAASLNINRGGTAGKPIALVAYPGATVTIGGKERHGLRLWNDGLSKDHWVIAGFKLRGESIALVIWEANHWRVVGNDISCPNGNGQTGCLIAMQAEHIQWLGNEVHNTGREGAQKQYHATYLGTDVNHAEVAYNRIHDNNACYGLQIHSSPFGDLTKTGFKQYDIAVHHNTFWNQNCAAFNAYTVDPSKGPVRFYNNTVYRVAHTVSPDGGNTGCFYVPGNYVTSGPRGSGAIDYYNNILVDCGGAASSLNYAPGAITVDEHDNACWGLKACTGAGSFSADPMFADPAAGNFRVKSTDPRFKGKGAEE